MDRRRLKFLVLGGGVLAAMGFLLAVGVKQEGGMAYYKHVGEYLALGADERNKGYRISGEVADGSIERLRTGLDVRFAMVDKENPSAQLPVAYHGIIPDTFVDGADVVVEGRMDADGTFRAHTLLAKCPSKYEAAAEEGEDHPSDIPRGAPATGL